MTWSRGDAMTSITRFGRFNAVGMLGAALQLLFTAVLTRRCGLGAAASTAIAVEAVVLHNFIWHRRFTWRDRGGRRLAVRLWRFHAANGLVSLLGNTLLVYGLADRLHAPVLPSALAAIALCSVANFFLADRWVYADGR